MQQEIDYKEFIKECPELREAMWNQNIVLPPMPNAQTTSMVSAIFPPITAKKNLVAKKNSLFACILRKPFKIL